MGERIGSTATSAAMALVVGFCAIGLSVDRAAGQARGVIIQIPDDVAPGSARPAPQPAPPPVAAPAPAVPGYVAGGTSCRGSACASGKNLWHVVNTSNRTCLALSKDDLKGGKDVRKLSTLLPSPLFVVAAGACP